MKSSEGLISHKRLFFLEMYAINQSINCSRHEVVLFEKYLQEVCSVFLQYSLFTQHLRKFTVFPVFSQSFCPAVSISVMKENNKSIFPYLELGCALL